MNFYSVIIGTELLNARRVDAHFECVNKQLLKRGWEQKANFVIKDDPAFMEDVFRLIKKDKKSVMFCFGGIGSTPDDYTRVCASNVFGDKVLYEHKDSLLAMKNHFKQEPNKHHKAMANLPLNAKLLHNVVNRVSGFYLQDRFFFMPGFPNMSHPMVSEALDKFYKTNPNKKYHKVLLAHCKESLLIDFMEQLPKNIDLSSLPMMNEGKNIYATNLHLSCTNKVEVVKEFEYLISILKEKNIQYELGDKQI
jgi:molybdopterin-biosynthesis enzyme MoeA-like protein